MMKLEQLMQELCPNGVEYKKLNTICGIYDGTHQTPKYVENGVKFASVENINNPYDTKKYISVKDFKKYKIKPQCNDILMTRIGSIGVCTVINRDEPLAYYVSLALLRPDNSILNSKFLKYSIESLHGRKELRKRTLVNAVPIKINKDDIGKITVPVPPLEVQAEIVRILDKFTELTTELTTELATELANRKKQYEYYRDELLRFDSTANKSQIGDLCNIIVGGDVPKEHYSKEKSDTFCIPIISNGIGKNAIYGYTNIVKVNQSAVTIAARGTIGYAEYRDYPYYPIIRLLSVIPKNNGIINTKYLYYCLQGRMYKVPKTGIPQLTVPMLKKEIICVPTLETQNHIVSVLDRFDKLCNDISEGLPAEIEARQKQYEYYRDKLLKFKEVNK